MDVTISYQFSNKLDLSDFDEQARPRNLEEEMQNINLMELIIISQDNKAYKIWKFFVVLHSLISSYFYAYMAAFHKPVPGQ